MPRLRAPSTPQSEQSEQEKPTCTRAASGRNTAAAVLLLWNLKAVVILAIVAAIAFEVFGAAPANAEVAGHNTETVGTLIRATLGRFIAGITECTWRTIVVVANVSKWIDELAAQAIRTLIGIRIA